MAVPYGRDEIAGHSIVKAEVFPVKYTDFCNLDLGS